MTTTAIDAARGLWRDPILRLFLIVEAIVFAPYVLPLLEPRQLESYADLYAMLPTKLVVIVALLWRPWRERHAVERRFWLLLAGAYGCWVVADLLAAGMPLTWIHNPSSGLLEDLLFVGFYLLVALALERRPHDLVQRDGASRLRSYRVAGAIVFAAGLLVYFAVIPREFEPRAFVHLVPSMALYVSLDLYVLARVATLRTGCGDPAWRRVYGLLIVTAALWTVLDTIEGLLYAEILPWIPVGTLLDLPWHLPFVAVVAAARIRELPAPARTLPDAPPVDERRGAWGGPVILYAVAFPMIHLIVMLLGVSDDLSRTPRELVVVLIVLVLTTIALFYQRHLEIERRALAEANRAARASLHVAQRMEAVGRLAGGVAHDFNNVLQVVRASSDLARSSLDPAAGEQRELRAIDEAVGRAATLTEQLLAVGRRTEKQPRLVDMNAIVRDTCRMLARVIGDDVAMRVELDPRLAPIMADPGELGQVVMNLGANARDSMPRGGTLEIRTAATDGASTLVVRDSGHGMDAETRERIFEPFFTTRATDGGTGLGLAVVYGIVTGGRGRIEVDSEPGRGTTFTVLFPAIEGSTELPRAEPARRTAPLGGAESILVVEDEPVVRKLVARQLRMLGYEVSTAADGVRALALLERRTQPIDVVLSDVMMPRMPGTELARIVRERYPGTAVLLMSGYAGDVDEVTDGDTPLLRKPFTRSELAAALRAAVGERRTA